MIPDTDRIDPVQLKKRVSEQSVGKENRTIPTQSRKKRTRWFWFRKWPYGMNAIMGFQMRLATGYLPASRDYQEGELGLLYGQDSSSSHYHFKIGNILLIPGEPRYRCDEHFNMGEPQLVVPFKEIMNSRNDKGFTMKISKRNRNLDLESVFYLGQRICTQIGIPPAYIPLKIMRQIEEILEQNRNFGSNSWSVIDSRSDSAWT